MINTIIPCYECDNPAQYRYIQPNGDWGFTFCTRCLWHIVSTINSSPYGGYPVHVRPLNLENIESVQNEICNSL